jgi:type I restriction enzyme S subunit
MNSIYTTGRIVPYIKQVTGIQNLDLHALLRIHVQLPPQQTQRAIADLLDAETERIDKILEKRQRMLGLLQEKLAAQLEATLGRFSAEIRSLGKVLTHLLDHRGRTPGKLGGDFQEFGVPVISARSIAGGQIVQAADGHFVSDEMYQQWMPRKLIEGDVILTSEAPLGEVALVRSGDLPLCLGQRVFALRPDPQLLLPEYLFFALQSRAIKDQLARLSTGSTAEGIRQRYLVGLQMPLPSIADQQMALEQLRRIGLATRSASSRIAAQIELLTERRRALISATGTG